MQYLLHFFTFFLHFSAKIGAFLFIPPNTLHTHLQPQPPQNHPKRPRKSQPKAMRSVFLGRRANRALLPRCVPSFCRSRRAIRCETPCGTPAPLARPVGVPSVAEITIGCCVEHRPLGGPAWYLGAAPPLGGGAAGPNPEIPAAGNLPRFCRPARAARPLYPPNARFITHAFLPRTNPPNQNYLCGSRRCCVCAPLVCFRISHQEEERERETRLCSRSVIILTFALAVDTQPTKKKPCKSARPFFYTRNQAPCGNSIATNVQCSCKVCLTLLMVRYGKTTTTMKSTSKAGQP